MSSRNLLRDAVCCGAGLTPLAGGGLRYTPHACGGAPPNLAALQAAKSILWPLLTDHALELSWPGLPVAWLTPTMRVLLAWYALERAAFVPGQHARVERRVDALTGLGWPSWHAEIIATEGEVALANVAGGAVA